MVSAVERERVGRCQETKVSRRRVCFLSTLSAVCDPPDVVHLLNASVHYFPCVFRVDSIPTFFVAAAARGAPLRSPSYRFCLKTIAIPLKVSALVHPDTPTDTHTLSLHNLYPLYTQPPTLPLNSSRSSTCTTRPRVPSATTTLSAPVPPPERPVPVQRGRRSECSTPRSVPRSRLSRSPQQRVHSLLCYSRARPVVARPRQIPSINVRLFLSVAVCLVVSNTISLVFSMLVCTASS